MRTYNSRLLAPPSVWQSETLRDWSILVRPRPWPCPAPGCLCVAYGGGVSSEWSPPPAKCCCGVPRPLRESGGRGERVSIGLNGNCCVSPSRWCVAPSSGACVYGDCSLPGFTHVPWARAFGVGLVHTRLSGQIPCREAQREVGTGEARRFFPARGPRAAERGPLRKRGQPQLPAVVAAAAAAVTI